MDFKSKMLNVYERKFKLNIITEIQYENIKEKHKKMDEESNQSFIGKGIKIFLSVIMQTLLAFLLYRYFYNDNIHLSYLDFLPFILFLTILNSFLDLFTNGLNKKLRNLNTNLLIYLLLCIFIVIRYFATFYLSYLLYYHFISQVTFDVFLPYLIYGGIIATFSSLILFLGNIYMKLNINKEYEMSDEELLKKYNKK